MGMPASSYQPHEITERFGRIENLLDAPPARALLVLYHYTKWWWVEFTTINLMYVLSNLFTAVVEGFFNEAYLRYLEIWSLMTLLFFFLALPLNPSVKRARHRLFIQFRICSMKLIDLD